MSTVFLNVGRDQLVTPADIVGKIAGVTRLTADVVGAIDIHSGIRWSTWRRARRTSSSRSSRASSSRTWRSRPPWSTGARDSERGQRYGRLTSGANRLRGSILVRVLCLGGFSTAFKVIRTTRTEAKNPVAVCVVCAGRAEERAGCPLHLTLRRRCRYSHPCMEAALDQPVLVLNRLWQAVNVIGARRAFGSWRAATRKSFITMMTISGRSALLDWIDFSRTTRPSPSSRRCTRPAGRSGCRASSC